MNIRLEAWKYLLLARRERLRGWHPVVAWRGLAELAQKYLRKGSHLYVEGRLKNRSYEDKEGIKRYVTEIVAESFLLLDKPEAEK